MKPLVRLYPVDIELMEWRRVPEADNGVREKILAHDADTGSSTRLLRLEPGAETNGTAGDCWEELFVLEGTLKWGSLYYPTGSYVLRAPGSADESMLTAEGFTALQLRDFHGASMDKEEVRRYPVDIERMDWSRPDGSPNGVVQKVLSAGPSGSATRILRVDPNVDTGIFNHDHCEEVLILEGSYKMGDEFHPAGTYTCKGPHVDHGPFWTHDGYVCLEIRNYA